MAFDGADRDVQLVGDLGVHCAGRDEVQDFELPSGHSLGPQADWYDMPSSPATRDATADERFDGVGDGVAVSDPRDVVVPFELDELCSGNVLR